MTKSDQLSFITKISKMSSKCSNAQYQAKVISEEQIKTKHTKE